MQKWSSTAAYQVHCNVKIHFFCMQISKLQVGISTVYITKSSLLTCFFMQKWRHFYALFVEVQNTYLQSNAWTVKIGEGSGPWQWIPGSTTRNRGPLPKSRFSAGSGPRFLAVDPGGSSPILTVQALHIYIFRPHQISQFRSCRTKFIVKILPKWHFHAYFVQQQWELV